jgi:hypothetical protein
MSVDGGGWMSERHGSLLIFFNYHYRPVEVVYLFDKVVWP